MQSFFLKKDINYMLKLNVFKSIQLCDIKCRERK